MSRVASVEVAGGGDAAAVARRVAQMGAPRPAEFRGDRWMLQLGEANLHVEDQEPTDAGGFSVAVDVWAPASDDATEAAAADLYRRLAARTEWGLRQLDYQGSTVAERPAVSRAS